jgi:hypothetical protein
MSDEQRVRTMAGWIGVEISKSRVRTPGKAGYGLYRVRPAPRLEGMESWDEAHSWTAYAFEPELIAAEVELAIRKGTPAKPFELMLPPTRPGSLVTVVPTRWTSAYRGRRDLGVSEAERLATAALGAQLETSTVRSRQRAQNAEFQRGHKARRDWGLKQRHARKTAHNARRNNDAG